MNKKLYFLFLSIFILRVAFTIFPYDTPAINWYKLYPEQVATFQWAFWRLSIFLVELLLLVAIAGIVHETDAAKKYHIYKMAKILLWIQGWYILEYCLHYTSVWITWEQLGFNGDSKDGLSSHIITMGIFAYFGWSDD